MRFDKILKNYRVEKIARKYIWLQPLTNGEALGKIQYLDKSDSLFNEDDFVVGTEVKLFCTTVNKGTRSYPKYFCILEDLDAYKLEVLDTYFNEFSRENLKEVERFKWNEETTLKIESHKETTLKALSSSTKKVETKEELEEIFEGYRMPFGKYKKCLVELIPSDYIDWLYSKIQKNEIDNEEVVEAVIAKVKYDKLVAKTESSSEESETIEIEDCEKQHMGFMDWREVDSKDFSKEGYELVHRDLQSYDISLDEGDDTFADYVTVYCYYRKLEETTNGKN